MAQQNKLIGSFHLDGIMPARRGEPQIEVTFDIDANGILNVTAKDKATGKEQKIRIEASSGLSDEEIKRMKAEAEANAEADKKEKERIEKLNRADADHFRNLHMRLLSQQLYRILKFQMLHLHHKIDGAAAGMTAEAVIHLALRIHRKGSRLFSMKWTKPPVTSALGGQLYISGYDLHDIGPFAKLIQPRLWESACQRSFTVFSALLFFAAFSRIPA